MASFYALRSELPANRPRGIAVDLVGTATGWTGSTAFTLSGTAASGSSILTKVVEDATHARLVIATTDTLGTLSLSIGDGTNTVTNPIKVKRYRRPRWPF